MTQYRNIMKGKSRIVVVAVLICAGLTSLYLFHPRVQLIRHFGIAALRVVENADRVEVYRIDQAAFSEVGIARGDWLKYTLGKPVMPSKDWTKEFQRVVLDPSRYNWHGEPNVCAFVPLVGMRFIRGSEEMHVLLCFHCHMISISVPGVYRWRFFDSQHDPSAVPGHERQSLAFDDYSSLVKELFPADPVIGKLRQ